MGTHSLHENGGLAKLPAVSTILLRTVKAGLPADPELLAHRPTLNPSASQLGGCTASCRAGVSSTAKPFVEKIAKLFLQGVKAARSGSPLERAKSCHSTAVTPISFIGVAREGLVPAQERGGEFHDPVLGL